jgi:hypothetical protein
MPPEVHIPGKTEAEFAAQETAAAEAQAAAEKAAADAEAAEKAKADEAAAAAEVEAKAKADADAKAAELKITKPRSVYDDLKDTRKERNEARTEAETEKARADAAEAKAAELEALLKQGKDAKTTTEQTVVVDDIKAYAEKHGLDVPALNDLIEVMSKRVGAPQLPEEVTKRLTELEGFKATKEAQEKREAEDREIQAAAPAVKTSLEINDDAELGNVMKEVMRLAHTEQYADKEVDYIVWKNKDALSKLVSPKKPSFESGGTRVEADAAAEVSFDGKMTPAAAQKAILEQAPKSALEIRGSK